MLVAISGAQGCGKTTVINELKKQNYDVIERKTSRSILDEWNVTLSQVNNDRPLTQKFQDEILKRKWNDEFPYNHENLGRLCFTERTYMDLATYACVALGKDNEYSDWLNGYFKRCAACQQSYALVFYMSGGHFKIEQDNVRGTNVIYGKMVDLLMRDLTKQTTLPSRLVVIDTPDLTSRISLITCLANDLWTSRINS